MIAAAILCMTIPTGSAYAVFVTPVVVLFGKDQNTTRITLNNRSDKTKVVTFGWERRVLDQNGKARILQEGDPMPPTYHPLDPYVKFSPRRTILKPRQRQTIRLIAQRPQNMESGEYRSHFVIKEEDLVDQQAVKSSDQNAVSGQVLVNLNKSIPVFLRHGETSVNAQLLNASYGRRENGKPSLDVSITNNSTRSVYAHIHLVCPGEEVNATNRGVPVRLYAEVKNVTKSYKVKAEDVKTCPGLMAKLVPTNDAEFGGQVIAEIAVR